MNILYENANKRCRQYNQIKEYASNAIDLCGDYSEIRDYCKRQEIDFDSPFCQSAIFEAVKEYNEVRAKLWEN